MYRPTGCAFTISGVRTFGTSSDEIPVAVDCGVRGILQFDAKDERILLFEAPHITDPQLEIVIVVGRVWRGVENALESVWIILLEKRIGFRLVQERK
jgi:hypothetical protein